MKVFFLNLAVSLEKYYVIKNHFSVTTPTTATYANSLQIDHWHFQSFKIVIKVTKNLLSL